MPQTNNETPTLVNKPSNPIIITTEEDEEDEVTKQLTYASEGDANNPSSDNGTNPSEEENNNDKHQTQDSPTPATNNEEQEVIAIPKNNSADPIKTQIIPAPPLPPPPPSPISPQVKKSNSTVNFLNRSKSKVTKYIPTIDDSTKHKKRGTGILASDADLSASPEVFAQGCTLLQLCAIGNLSDVQSYITNTFSNVNFRDYDRRTGLHVASSEGHLDVVIYLINKGARVNRTDRWGGSALDDAHRHRHSDVAKYLRMKGGKSGSLNLTTNLISAAAAGDIEEVKMILTSMDDRGTMDMSGSRRKTMMDDSRSKATMGRLARKPTATSTTDLDMSEQGPMNGGGEVVDINKGDYDKRTPLHLASSEGHYDVVEYLCKHGADVNVADRWGGRPLDDAIQKGNKRVEELLRKYGATCAASSNHSHRALDPLRMSLTNNGSKRDSEIDQVEEDLRVDFKELDMIERIGSGAFGEIYKCRWRGILVAAKCIKASKIQKEWILKNRNVDQSSRIANRIEAIKQASITEEEKQLALEDFRRETAIMRRLRHPNIVMMLAYSHSDDIEVMVSELMKCSLLDIFRANHISNTQMPKRTQVIYAQQLAQGMNHLHKCRPPIIHRDLKPANLLIDFSGTLKITDFGLAKIRPNPEQTEKEAFLMTGETGSYRFMAPEVFRHEEYTETVDVYSYSMIFYYMLRGIPPWHGLSGVDAATKAAVDGERPVIPRDVDARLAALLKRCWDEDPMARPSFEEIIQALAVYSHDVFQTNDTEVALAKEESGCACLIS